MCLVISETKRNPANSEAALEPRPAGLLRTGHRPPGSEQRRRSCTCLVALSRLPSWFPSWLERLENAAGKAAAVRMKCALGGSHGVGLGFRPSPPFGPTCGVIYRECVSPLHPFFRSALAARGCSTSNTTDALMFRGTSQAHSRFGALPAP